MAVKKACTTPWVAAKSVRDWSRTGRAYDEVEQLRRSRVLHEAVKDTRGLAIGFCLGACKSWVGNR